MRLLNFLTLVTLAACGATPKFSRRTTEDAPALQALRAAKFDDASRLASSQLELDPRDSEAAAIRALASYVTASSAMLASLDVRHSWFPILNALKPAQRPAVAAFLDRLGAVEKDLAIVADDAHFSLELCLACWRYDWNQDGAIDDSDTSLLTLETFLETDPRSKPTFRFDVGDVAWARAMISFQRAAGELFLSYRWTDANLNSGEQQPVTIHLLAPERVEHALTLILAGLTFSDTAREEYLAETDDDREWVPNPHQTNHPIPMDVDERTYQTWAAVVREIRQLVTSKKGVSMREAVETFPKKNDFLAITPDSYLDLGRMLSEPTDIVLAKNESGNDRESVTRFLRGLLGHGYSEHMSASGLTHRLAAMKGDLESSGDALERKLRYLFWIN